MAEESKQSNSDPKGADNEEGGIFPAVLAGAFLLAAAGYLMFGGDDDTKDSAKASTEKSKSAAVEKSAGKSGAVDTPIGSRSADEATKSKRRRGNVNPAIFGGMEPMMAPAAPPEPKEFDSPEEELAYWKKRLRSAEENVKVRERGVERMKKLEANPRPNARPIDKERVLENLEKSKEKLKEIEEKVRKLEQGE